MPMRTRLRQGPALGVASGMLVSCTIAVGGVAPSAAALASRSLEHAWVAAPAVVPALPRVVYRVKTKDPVFFITIDDGSYKQSAAARYVRTHKVPVTVFLTANAIDRRWDFFSTMGRYDSVQNHSMTHRALGKDSTDRSYEICATQRMYKRAFGVRPWLLRPPYGDGYFSRRWAAPAIERTAATCGISHIVLWNFVVLKDGHVLFVNKLRFEAGDIVLMHFEGDLKANIHTIIAHYARHGLKPAALSKYLTPPA